MTIGELNFKLSLSGASKVGKRISDVGGEVENAANLFRDLGDAMDTTFEELAASTGQGVDLVNRLEGQFADLERRVDLTSEQISQGFKRSMMDIERAANSAIKSFDGLNRAMSETFNELVERTGQGLRSVDSMEAAFADLGQRAELTADQLQEAVLEQRNIASSGVTMRSSVSASANNLGFELVQAAQDAKFGLAGVANQIPLMSEQFTQLRSKTGSTSAALKALGGSLLGTAGLVGGVTLAITFLPDLISGLGDTEEAARDAKEEFQGLTASIARFQDFSKQIASGIDSIRSAIENAQTDDGLIDALFGGARTAFQALQPPDIVEAAGENVSFAPLRESAQAVQDVLGQSTESARLLRTALRNTGADVKSLLQANLQGSRAELVQFLRTAEQADLSTLEKRLPDLVKQPGVLAGAIEQAFGDLRQQLGKEVELGLTTPLERARQESNFLDSALKQVAASDFDRTNEAFATLRERAVRARNRVDELGKEADDVDIELPDVATFEDRLSAFESFVQRQKRLVPSMEDLVGGQDLEGLTPGRLSGGVSVGRIRGLADSADSVREVNQVLDIARSKLSSVGAEGFAALKGIIAGLQDTKKELRGTIDVMEQLDEQTRFILKEGLLRIGDEFGRAVTDAIFSIGSGLSRLEKLRKGLTELQLQQRQRRLRERLSEATDGLELQIIQQQLKIVGERLRQARKEIGFFGKAFKGLTSIFRTVVRAILKELTALIAKLAIVALLKNVLGGPFGLFSSGVGGSVGGGLGGALNAPTIASRTGLGAAIAAASVPTVSLRQGGASQSRLAGGTLSIDLPVEVVGRASTVGRRKARRKGHSSR